MFGLPKYVPPVANNTSTYTVRNKLNGQVVTNYAIPGNSTRGREGHIGLQCHTGNVQFQNIKIRALPDSA